MQNNRGNRAFEKIHQRIWYRLHVLSWAWAAQMGRWGCKYWRLSTPCSFGDDWSHGPKWYLSQGRCPPNCHQPLSKECYDPVGWRHTTNLMRSKRTSFLSKSATFRTASTAIVAIFFLKLHDHSNNTTSYLLTILELSVVIAVSMRASGFSFVNVIVSAMVLRYSTAILQAYTVNDNENQILVRNHQQFWRDGCPCPTEERPKQYRECGRTYFLQQSSSKDNNTSSTVTNLVILALRQLNEKLGSLMLDLHVLHDGGAIVCDANITILTDQHFVHTYCSGMRWGVCLQRIPLGPRELLNTFDKVLAATILA